MKNILWWIFAVALVVVAVVWFLTDPPLEHIADTNGADNYALQEITEQNVINLDIGATGIIGQTEHRLDFGTFGISSGVKYSSKKFTGVERLVDKTIFKGSDIYVSLAEYEIKSGNFCFYVVFDGEIVGTIMPGDGATAEFTLDNIEKSGSLELVIAGESAGFSFVAISGFE